MSEETPRDPDYVRQQTDKDPVWFTPTGPKRESECTPEELNLARALDAFAKHSKRN
jgi:hypothetical protein